ncbi:MAG TPA: methyl-accepting chemotaxis protein [Nostocaceae cyanobacterium]|nr:methyl-accepting chemotaxis protein [Nostocaceae cyanobacterium]
MKRINQFVIGGCGVIVILTFIASWVSNNTNKTLIDAENSVTNAYLHKEQIREIEKILVDAETGQRGFLLTKREEYLEPYISAQNKINEKLQALGNEFEQDREQFSRFENLKELATERLSLLAQTIELKKTGKDPEALNIVLSDRGKHLMDKSRKILEEMLKSEDRDLELAKKNADASQQFANFIIWFIFACIVITVILVCAAIILIPSRALSQSLQTAFNLAEKVAAGDLTTSVDVSSSDEVVNKLMITLKHMTKSLSILVHQVQTSGIEVTISSTQIAASGKQLEATITEQVASTNEVVATTKEISTTSRKLAKTMEDVVGMLQSTTRSASDSQKDLTDMENSMRQLAEANNSIASRLGVISEKANNINNIVVTITKVADQTNLLSLNAAIEAEKAGEYGLGFAVVAREIRRLADQTAVATLDIEQMIKEMQSSVATGVMEMDKFTTEVRRGVEDVAKIGSQMGQIIEQVQDLYPHFESVNQGMEIQAQGAQQISEAIMQLGQTSAQTADSLREINKAIAQLNQVSQGLREAISRFSVKSDNIPTAA